MSLNSLGEAPRVQQHLQGFEQGVLRLSRQRESNRKRDRLLQVSSRNNRVVVVMVQDDS